MVWALVLIWFTADDVHFKGVSIYQTEADCIAGRAIFMEMGPQPKINYESVCIGTDQLNNLGAL